HRVPDGVARRSHGHAETAQPVLPALTRTFEERGHHKRRATRRGRARRDRLGPGGEEQSVIHSGGPLAADIPDIDLASFTLRRASELGDKAALIDADSGRTLTYAELDRSVRSFAAGLAARGFGKGDTFGIFMPNVPEYAVAFHGVVAAGGRCT